MTTKIGPGGLDRFRNLVFAIWLTLLASSLLIVKSSAQDSAESITVFCKAAISKAPDTELFLVKFQQLRQRRKMDVSSVSGFLEPQYWIGGKHGGNFFLASTNIASGDTNSSVPFMVVGRHAGRTFQISANAISLTDDSESSFPNNPVVGMGKGYFALLNQALNFGVGSLDENSVVWNGDEFTAYLNGNKINGNLIVSNHVPREVQLRVAHGGEPFKTCSFRYPASPSSLAGFPAEIVISTLSPEGLRPYLEISFLQVEGGSSKLSEKIFSEARFITPKILNTNTYLNGVLQIVSPSGQPYRTGTQIIPRNESASGERTRNVRPVVLSVLFLTSLVCAFLVWKSGTTQTTKNAER